MVFGDRSLQPRSGVGDGVGSGYADDVEALRPGKLLEEGPKLFASQKSSSA
jgi:hypothetical protein